MSTSIAVIGIGCRLPGADTPDQFWDLVVSGRNCFERVDAAESAQWGWADAQLARPDFVPVRSALSGFDMFDAGCFRVSQRDAILMDPQQRIFLETVRMALDDARADTSSHRVGVFASSTASSYLLGPLAAAGLWNDHDLNFGAMLGCDKDFLSARVSYLLDLRGPSVAVQTACSSSLTAVGLAAESLARRECDLAVVGGSSISLPHLGGYLASTESILSPSGVCRPFDARADGTIKGNGAVAVVLARAEDVDPEVVYARIAGYAVNNDGGDRAGFPAPGLSGQTAVVATAHQGLGGGRIAYVETHGTGTRLGDPIEIRALGNGLDRAGTPYDEPIALGGLKATMGHLDAAAGVAGLAKACLVIHHGVIPPLAGFAEPNPLLGLDRFTVPTTARAWGGTTMAVGVSSFGMGGSNAHVVLQGQVRRSARDHEVRAFSRTRYWPTPRNNPAVATPAVASSAVGSAAPAGRAGSPPTATSLTAEAILDLAREVLLDPTLEMDDNFFEAGADSLAMVGLLGELEGYGHQLDFTVLQQDPTVRGLAKLLNEASAAPAPSSSLIWLSQGSPKLYLAHPAGGTTVCYVDLAKQLPMALGGLNFPPRLVAGSPTLRELASVYLDEIVLDQPTGPLWIGGWSFGGNLAAEMAVQLAARGRDDVRLVMIDAYPPLAYIVGRTDEEGYVRSFPTLLTQLFPDVVFRSSPVGAKTIRQVLDLVAHPAWPESMLGQLELFHKVWVANHIALKHWLPDQMITVPTLIIEADVPQPNEIIDNLGIARVSVHGWDQYLSQPPTYVPVPGNHYEIMRQPQTVSMIGEAIKRFMGGA